MAQLHKQHRRKIILVDDSIFALTMVKTRLKDIYDVYPAQSADALFSLLEKVTPGVILLDIKMPDVDGYETLKMLKADERYSEIPVIFLTANSNRSSVIKGVALGAADYVLKPFAVDRLYSRIENLLGPYICTADLASPENDAGEGGPEAQQTCGDGADAQQTGEVRPDAQQASEVGQDAQHEGDGGPVTSKTGGDGPDMPQEESDRKVG